MGIFSRMSDIINANINALLDQVEDPNRSVESLLSELQVQLKAAQRELVRVVASERQLAQQIERLEGLEQRWQQRAELARAHRVGRTHVDHDGAGLREPRRLHFRHRPARGEQCDVQPGRVGGRGVLDLDLLAAERQLLTLGTRRREEAHAGGGEIPLLQ